MSMCTGPGYRLMLLSCFDPPDPPEESACKHGTYKYNICEECEDAEATRADEIIKERKEE